MSPSEDDAESAHHLVRETSSVPDLETDPKKSRVSLRKAEPISEITKTMNEKVHRKKSRTGGLKDSDQSLLKVDLLPSGDMGQRIDVAGYGAAPRGEFFFCNFMKCS